MGSKGALPANCGELRRSLDDGAWRGQSLEACPKALRATVDIVLGKYQGEKRSYFGDEGSALKEEKLMASYASALKSLRGRCPEN